MKFTSTHIAIRLYDFLSERLFSYTRVLTTIRLLVLLSSIVVFGTTHSNSFFQQNGVISGNVVDKDEQPLLGVSILEKGTTNGTTTNFEGDFSLTVSSNNAVLVFSFLGYVTQEVKLSGRQQLAVKMEKDIKDLDEVVITAYGKVKKETLTDAVAKVDIKKLENRPVRTVADALQGLAPGLNIGVNSGAPEAVPTINIRGFTGINTSGAPLVLIDGVERPIQDINPNDVASVSVLKDGASSSIYGSRAPYGVILITTKRGKKGKVDVTYTSNFRFSTPGNLPTLNASYDWADYINQVTLSNPNGTGQAVFNDLTIKRMRAWAAGDFTNSVFDGIDPKWVKNGQLPKRAEGNSPYFDAFANVDYFKAAMNDFAPSQQQNLSFSGATDKVKYFNSVGYNGNDGIFKGADNYNRRYNLLSKISFATTDWLEFSASINYIRQDNQGANYRGQAVDYGSVFGNLSREFYNVPVKTPNGTYTAPTSVPQYLGLGGLVKNVRNDITMTGGFLLTPFKDKGIRLVGNYTWRVNNNQRSLTQKVVSASNPDGSPTLSQRTAGVSKVEKTYGGLEYTYGQLKAEYKKTFADAHHVLAQAGLQVENTVYNSLTGSGQNLIAQNALTTLSTTTSSFQAKDQLYDWATLGYYGLLSYDYQNRYLVKFSIRRDASSRFSKDARWGVFPSVSVGWNIAKESFFPEKVRPWVSTFKLRGSWSTSGDLASAGSDKYYPFIPTLGVSRSAHNLLGGGFALQTSAPNLVSSALTWGKPTTLDFGVDIVALNNRLSVTYDWFQRTVYDLAGPPDPLPKTLGTDAPQKNNSVIETRGWDFSIKWLDSFALLGESFKYDVSFLLSDYIGYVVDYSANTTGARGGTWTKGQVFGRNYHYEAGQIQQGTSNPNKDVLLDSYTYPGYLLLKDTNGDGYVNGGVGNTWSSLGDLKENGFSYPRKRYSINPSISWKNFKLSAVFSGVFQWTVFTNSSYVFGTNGSRWFSPFFKESTSLGYWTPQNKNTFFPAVAQGRTENNRYSLDLSHLRIQNVTIGYDLPKNLLKKVRLNRCYVYLSGENLGFVYNNSYIKYDPNLLSAASGQGYPPMRIYSFGLTIGL